MKKVYLSRRNLKTLLSKLDRVKAGEESACTLVKYQNTTDPFVQTIDEVSIIAVEDDKYYTNRPAGEVHPADVPH